MASKYKPHHSEVSLFMKSCESKATKHQLQESAKVCGLLPFPFPPSLLLLLFRFGLLNLHPLRSRVMDMEHKLRVAMDNLIGKVKVAASSRPPPGEYVNSDSCTQRTKMLPLSNVLIDYSSCCCFIVIDFLLFIVFRCNSRDALQWLCSYHVHSGLPDGGSVCLSGAQCGHSRLGADAVPLGQGHSK